MRRLAMMAAGLVLGAGGAWAALPAGPAAVPAELAAMTRGLVPGAPQTCLDLNRRPVSTKSVGTYLVYRSGPRRLWVTDTGSEGCKGVNRGDTIVTQTTQTRLCRGDIAEVANLRTGFRSGGCTIGSFVPYTPG